MTAAGPVGVPVLVVHGIWDTSARLAPLCVGLRRRGVDGVHPVDLIPHDGRASISELGRSVARAAEELARRESAAQIDLVGFSMGALVSRWYLQRGGGRGLVRRFVSIAGPHHGTLDAYAIGRPGVRDMRPGSALLADLARDPDPFGATEVHCLYTPFDLMIVPPRSGVLAGATSVRAFPVPMHRFMIQSRDVLDHVAALLRA